MATREEYARWIVENADKRGTPEFETVAQAYKMSGEQQPKQAASRPARYQPGPVPQAAQAGIRSGMASLLGLPVDTLENVYNLGAAGVGTLAGLAGKPELMPQTMQGTPLGSQWLKGKLGQIGLPTDNPAQDSGAARMAHTAGTIAGGSLFPGATLRNTAAAAAGGALAGEALGDEYVAVGAMAPAAAGAAVSGVRQGLANRTAQNAKMFRDAGAQPSVGTATDNTFLHGIENLLSKFPGGAGVMKNFREQLQKDLGKEMWTGATAEDAGRAIERGVTGKGTGFIDRTKNTWKMLDDRVAAKLPKDSFVSPKNTLDALEELTSPVPGAERSTAGLANPKLSGLRQGIIDDISENVSQGGIPYEALRKIRTRIGSLMDDALVSDVPHGELKRVYGALTDDMRAAAKDAGVLGTFERANQYYAARMERIDGVLNKVLGKYKQPEDIFKAIDPRSPDAAGKLTATLRSLKPDERKIIASAVINRLGRATPGRQDDIGEVFSTETFLTNWNKISPRAKAQLFTDSIYRDNLNKIAAVSANIRRGENVFKNASGTAGSFAAYSVYVSPLVSIATANPSAVIVAGSSAAAANIGAKLLTNQKFVNWLAKAPPSAQAVPVHFARLAEIYNSSDDEDFKKELAEYANRAGQQLNGAQ